MKMIFYFVKMDMRLKLKEVKIIFILLEFKDALNFAKVAYEVGNRHQPVMIEDLKIVVLDDISLR